MKFPSLILLLLISSKLFAQSSGEKFKSALMEKKDGAEVVYSSDKHSFTLDIISDNIKPLQQPGYVLVNNKTLQFVFIGNDALKQNENTEEQQKAQLLGYMQYELDYVKNEVKLNYTDLAHEWLTINNKIYLLWYYDMPLDMKSKKGGVLKQVNLSTLCFAHILNLNTPFEQGDSLVADTNFLTKVAQTLKQNDYEIDFNALYNELQKR
jgi:hypothetical protein